MQKGMPDAQYYLYVAIPSQCYYTELLILVKGDIHVGILTFIYSKKGSVFTDPFLLGPLLGHF
jgi:hypothetical protein